MTGDTLFLYSYFPKCECTHIEFFVKQIYKYFQNLKLNGAKIVCFIRFYLIKPTPTTT